MCSHYKSKRTKVYNQSKKRNAPLKGWCITAIKKIFENNDWRKIYVFWDKPENQGKGGKTELAKFLAANFSSCT